MADSKLFMSPDFLTTFIEEYRNLPCLWKVRSAEYSNKFKRDTAWEHLLQITKEKIPNADTNFVKRKVDNLRAAFRKEMRKVRDSTRSGASADDTYTPTLWYFELMKFTAEQEQPRKTKSNLDEDEENIIEEEGSIVEEELNEGDVNNGDNEQTLNRGSPSTAAKRRKTSPKKKKTKNDRAEEERRQRKAILEKASAVLNQPEDDYNDLGKTYAAKLRRMPASQRDIADKLITDVLFKGLQNNLTNSTVIMDYGYSTTSSWRVRDTPSPYGTSNNSTYTTSSTPEQANYPMQSQEDYAFF
ncbi:hypothetical protein J6590_106751 [Homalodisca vitripennis]|nr:hypothetical protein J6590_106751 [Homalodisca vitripennis]